MTRDEYEERKRRIEAQHRAGIELLEAACRQQLRALDLVWMTTAEGDVAFPPMALEPHSPEQNPAPISPSAAVSPAPPEAKPTANRPSRRAAWQLLEDIEKALTHVPEVFDRNDVCDALGYAPDRSSLYRILQDLIREGVLALANRGVGKHPSRYRKLATDASATGT